MSPIAAPSVPTDLLPFPAVGLAAPAEASQVGFADVLSALESPARLPAPTPADIDAPPDRVHSPSTTETVWQSAAAFVETIRPLGAEGTLRQPAVKVDTRAHEGGGPKSVAVARRPLSLPEGDTPAVDLGKGRLPARHVIVPSATASTMGAPSPEAEPAVAPVEHVQRQERAEVFNEHGLFRGGAAQAHPDPADRLATQRSPSSHPGTIPAAAAPIQPAGPSLTVTPVVRAMSEQATPGPGVAKAGGDVPAARRAPTTTLSPHAALAGAQPSARASSRPAALAEPDPAEIALPELAPADASHDHAAASVVLTVQATEQGVRVAANVDRLDRTERNRLRERIAATLSRHGVAAHEVLLNGDLMIRHRLAKDV